MRVCVIADRETLRRIRRAAGRSARRANIRPSEAESYLLRALT